MSIHNIDSCPQPCPECAARLGPVEPRPRILDLFCCQGGASAGYVAAGFDVTGVDLEPQPRYPYRFIKGDALEFLYYLDNDWSQFDAIHASPPCQAHSNAQRIQKNDHPDLIGPVRELLIATGLPYCIENVEGAPLLNPQMLCGTMFGLRTYRHRLFETNFPWTAPLHGEHSIPQAKMGRPVKPGEFMHVVGNFSGVDEAREIMGMPWANRDGLREAIPPAFTEWIGSQLMHHLAYEAMQEEAA